MAEEFKFIHAADFHLDQPMSGLAELPTHLKTTLGNAPYIAAERIFDLAIAEKVDFLLLAGDLFDMEAGGCRPAAFLLSQFERLADKGIAIYWCSGEFDHPDRWPAAVDLPSNVKTFSTPVVEEIFHRRRDRVIATIVASGHDSQRKNNADFIVESSAVFPIGLSYGRFDINAMVAKSIRYWAIGGSHRHQLQNKTTHFIASSGTPLGRAPTETGAHGCVLVRVDASGNINPQFVETDTFRWLPQNLSVAESVDIEELKTIMGERSLKLATDHSDQMLLVPWHFATSGSFNPQLRRPELRAELLQWIRHEFGAGQTGLWTTSIEFAPPANLPEGWYEEDTILGDFLRSVGRYQSDESMNLALHEYLPSYVDNNSVNSLVRVSEDQRKRILAAAALVGVEYLAANRDWEDAESSSQS